MLLFLMAIGIAGSSQINERNEYTILFVDEVQKEEGSTLLIWISSDRDLKTADEFRTSMCRAIEQLRLPRRDDITRERIADYTHFKITLFYRLDSYVPFRPHKVPDPEGEKAIERYRGYYAQRGSSTGVAAFRPPGEPLKNIQVGSHWCETRVR
jgi:hypothetical protein